MTTPLLRVDDVHATVHLRRSSQTLLNGVSFEIGEGEADAS